MDRKSPCRVFETKDKSLGEPVRTTSAKGGSVFIESVDSIYRGEVSTYGLETK